MKPITLNVTPVAKPRMTQSDRWNTRKCVMDYWMFKDEVRLAMGNREFPHPVHIVFVLPMPKHWSKKEKCRKDGHLHQQRPDWDNLAKGLTDALFEEDSHLCDVRVTKIWGRQGQIILHPMTDASSLSIAS